MIVVATDAQLSDRNLTRLAKRAIAGLSHTGASLTNGTSGYVIAFSTHKGVRRTAQWRNSLSMYQEVPNNRMSPLFQATIETTEEAIYNSLLMATTTESYNVVQQKMVRVEALPIGEVQKTLKRNKP